MLRTLLISALLTSTALAETWYVSSSVKEADFDNIQEAVFASMDGDTIYVFSGVYTGNKENQPTAVVDLMGKSLTLRAIETGGERVIIDGEHLFRGISCSGLNSTVTIDGFTIQDCGNNELIGGGIFCDNNNPTIKNCTLRRNHSKNFGGGMYFQNECEPFIDNCTIIGNNASKSGGGIFCEIGQMSISNSSIYGNSSNQIVGEYTDNGNNVISEPSQWTVDDDLLADFDNIQSAVEAALHGDEIVVMPGTYTATSWPWGVAGISKSLTIRSSDPDNSEIITTTIIDGQNKTVGFSTTVDAKFIHGMTITGLTFANGNYYGIGYAGNDDGLGSQHVTISNCVFTEGRGGVLALDAISTVNNCTFKNNGGDDGPWATFSSGMDIASEGSYSKATVTNCVFKNNSGYKAGGIYLMGSETIISDCVFEANDVTDSYDAAGGAVIRSYYNPNGDINIPAITTISNCNFNQNKSNFDAGAISIYGQSFTDIYDCTFTENSGSQAGGIYSAYAGTFSITNTSFTQNQSPYNWAAGGINNEHISDPITIIGSTICSNRPIQISGEWVDGGNNEISDDCIECPDFSGDGNVGVNDLVALIAAWNCTGCIEDIDNDGIVGVNDLIVLISYWGPCE